FYHPRAQEALLAARRAQAHMCAAARACALCRRALSRPPRWSKTAPGRQYQPASSSALTAAAPWSASGPVSKRSRTPDRLLLSGLLLDQSETPEETMIVVFNPFQPGNDHRRSVRSAFGLPRVSKPPGSL